MAQSARALVRYLPLEAPIQLCFISTGRVVRSFPDGSVEVEDVYVRGRSGHPALRWVPEDRIIEHLEGGRD